MSDGFGDLDRAGTQEVRVAGHVGWGVKGICITAAVAVTTAAAVLAAKGDVEEAFWIGVVVLAVAAPALLATAWVWWRASRRAAWLRDTGDGFDYRDRQGGERHRDEDVVGLELVLRRNYREGLVASVTRTMALKVAGREKPLPVVQTVKVDADDPLADFVQRTVERFRERADHALSQGVRLAGDGWSLGRDDLRTAGEEPRTVPIADLATLVTIDGEHRVWALGEDQPLLAVREDSRNAFLLGLMLGRRIEENPHADQPDPTAEGLGRRIFERGGGRAWIAWLAVGVVLALLGAVMAVVAWDGAEPSVFWVGVGLVVAGPLCLLGAWWSRVSTFRCHERGLHLKTPLRDDELRYEDVASFSFSSTRMYVNGAYTGTTVAMTFVPTGKSGLKRIRYSRQVKNGDQAIDDLRDHIAGMIAARMAAELDAAGAVPWTPGVALSREGFLLADARRGGSLPFAETEGMNLQDGKFHVWRKGVKKPVISEPASAPNFFPGFYLLGSLFADGPEEAAS